MNDELIKKASEKFLTRLEKHKDDPWNLAVHIREAEKWAGKVLEKYPEADKDVVMLSVWLHDIGHYPIQEIDHAVILEQIAREFFSIEKVNKELADKVLHCVRSHRNRDVTPATFEAKLFAMIDSVSHFTYIPYIEMAQQGRALDALSKLERDYRDVAPFPEVLKEIKPLYLALKNLLIELQKFDFEVWKIK
ncbi:MAG: HD domain-containing protein [Candidatus Berkelbacteria bacterium]|nr:HD domain-containing protein [Candidatus Berkelbacteria bacterium]